MRHRIDILAIASIIILARSSVASGQDTTKSQPRSTIVIPVGKDRQKTSARPTIDTARHAAAAAAARPATRTDTVRLSGRTETVTRVVRDTVARIVRDTVTRTHTDTVSRTITHVDTLFRDVAPREVGGFYFGLAVGSSFPAGTFNDANHPGWRAQVPVGFDVANSRLGARVDVGYSRYSPQDWVVHHVSSAQIIHSDADLKVRLAGVRSYDTHIKLYGIGGVSYARFKDIVEEASTGFYWIGNNSARNSLPAADDSWHNGLGFNAGAGLEMTRGITNVFFEGRFTSIQGVASTLRSFPVLLGVTLY